jgi:hypothetical protein
MAVVQRVSGNLSHPFLPQVAGVGIPKTLTLEPLDRPEAGSFGCLRHGHPAVDRSDDDYYPNSWPSRPLAAPERGFDTRRYSHNRMDVIDLKAFGLVSRDFHEWPPTAAPSLVLLASIDPEINACGGGTRDISLGGSPSIGTWGASFAHRYARISGHSRRLMTPPWLSSSRPTYPGGASTSIVQCRHLQVRTGPKVKGPSHSPKTGLGGGGQYRANRSERSPRRVGGQPFTATCPKGTVTRCAPHRPSLEKAERPPPTASCSSHGPLGHHHALPRHPRQTSRGQRVAALCEVVAKRDELVTGRLVGDDFFNELVRTHPYCPLQGVYENSWTRTS